MYFRSSQREEHNGKDHADAYPPNKWVGLICGLASKRVILDMLGGHTHTGQRVPREAR